MRKTAGCLDGLLQSRLEVIPKYIATHHRRLQNGPNSDRMPPVTYSSEVANRHFMANNNTYTITYSFFFE